MTISETTPVTGLPIWQADAALVVVETPRGSGNKLKFDTELGAYKLDRVLPVGMTFPFDFGFIPQTLADDGDPLDAVVLLDSPVYPGCVVPVRLIGNLEAEQRDEKGPWERNDRLIAVAEASKVHADIHSIRDLEQAMVDAIGTFFTEYHRVAGESFRVVGRTGARAADQAVKQAHRRFVERRGGKTDTAKSA